MRLKLAVVFSALLLPATVFSQTPIDVAESTLKVPAFGEEEFHYGFAEGDQLIFNFQELKGKELKEIEIVELPGASKFMDYKTKRITNKVLHITRTGIYKFRFVNSALAGRICKFRIQRIPANDSLRTFNTSVYWKTVYDTTYLPRQERYLVKSDTIATSMQQLAKVSSQGALNGNPNHTIIDYELPPGTVAWSYYIGVGKEGKAEFERATAGFVDKAAARIATIPGYGVMAALALYGVNAFTNIQGNDNVKYWFIMDWDNVQAFQARREFMQYKQGNVVNDAAQMKRPLVGKIYLGLINDNLLQAIEVHVRITSITIDQTWGVRTVNQMNINAKRVAYLDN